MNAAKPGAPRPGAARSQVAGPRPAEPQPAQLKKAAGIAAELRERIRWETPGWEPGAEVPTEQALVKEFGLSQQTVRGALEILMGERLVSKGQGRRTVVTPHNAPYLLTLRRPRTRLGAELDRVAEPPPALTGTDSEPRRRWDADETSVHPRLASWLRLPARATMARRILTLVVDGRPVVSSTSYLPPDLAADDGDGWREAEPGELALAGYTVRAIEARNRGRMPDPEERAALGMPPAVYLEAFSCPYQVLLPGRTVAAGVIVHGRGDRVSIGVALD